MNEITWEEWLQDIGAQSPNSTPTLICFYPSVCGLCAKFAVAETINGVRIVHDMMVEVPDLLRIPAWVYCHNFQVKP